MKKIKKYITILLVIIISLSVSNLLSSEVFLESTPKIRPNLGEYIAMKFKAKNLNLASLNPFQSKNPRELSENESKKRVSEIEEKLASIPFQTVAKGVQAKSNGEIGIKVINTAEVDKVTYEFTLQDGRKIKISIMKELIDKYGWKQEDIEKMANE